MDLVILVDLVHGCSCSLLLMCLEIVTVPCCLPSPPPSSILYSGPQVGVDGLRDDPGVRRMCSLLRGPAE